MGDVSRTIFVVRQFRNTYIRPVSSAKAAMACWDCACARAQVHEDSGRYREVVGRAPTSRQTFKYESPEHSSKLRGGMGPATQGGRRVDLEAGAAENLQGTSTLIPDLLKPEIP
jgi:hypothetical protein